LKNNKLTEKDFFDRVMALADYLLNEKNLIVTGELNWKNFKILKNKLAL